ncbi:MAG: hypothetical protein QOG52_2396, partial [Frankiaceae bacterium]|nr:hypothetical protein [Frankiaceae bacterium]
TVTPTVTVTPTSTETPTVTPTPTPTPTVSCPVPDGNHGDNVSAVARDKSKEGVEHGKAVSEMAKSDCGKSHEDADSPEPTETPDANDAQDDNKDLVKGQTKDAHSGDKSDIQGDNQNRHDSTPRGNGNGQGGNK